MDASTRSQHGGTRSDASAAAREGSAVAAVATQHAAATLLMRYGAGVSFDEKVAFLTEQLVKLEHAKEWKDAVKKELAKADCSIEQLQSVHSLSSLENPLLYCVLEKMGVVSSLKRAVIDLHCAAAQAVVAASSKQAKQDDASSTPDMQSSHGCNLNVVLKAREHWENITREEMLRFASETAQPLVAANTNTPSSTLSPAANGDNSSLTETSSDHGKKQNKPSATRFLYDGHDLLHAIQATRPSNRAADAAAYAHAAWGSIQLQLYSPPLLEFRRLFSELSPIHGEIGLDDLFSTEWHAFLMEKNRVGDLVLTHQCINGEAVLENRMPRQSPATCLTWFALLQVWCQALALRINTETKQHFQNLLDQVARWKYLTDDMYLLDLQQTFDSSDYFVFQDHLESVIMAFTRDSYVQKHALQVNGAVTHDSSSTDAEATPPNNCVPPNGVLPFGGLVMYATPLTYLYNDPVEIFYVFRELYVRYWSKLNAIRTDKSTVLGLCKLSEDLAVRFSASTVFHLINMGIKPLDIAFPWIQSAFSGVLEINQVLLLWDRVVGYNSLELIAILAAALFRFRTEELETVRTVEDVEEVFAELVEMQVVPLLQEYLVLLS
ncbi:Tbc1 domain family member 19, partial [Globisporangium splendens]